MRRRLLVERLGERRVLASITGAVFEDADHSLQREAEEAGAPSRLIYVDANDNAQLDNGERLVVAEQDGTFEFPNVADGTYLLRLFNGTQSQTQTVPVEATVGDVAIEVTGALQLEAANGSSLTLTRDSVVIGDLDSGSSQTLAVGDQLAKMQTLPDGTVLIISSGGSGPTSWVVDPNSQSVTPINLANTVPGTPWSDLAIDANGRGVILEPTFAGNPSQEMLGVREVNASAPSVAIEVSEILQTIPSDTQVLTSDTGSRSVFAWGGANGLRISLWSNESASFITQSPIDVLGTTELLDFDDASGLLAVRTADGGVSVHDADANFAPLHTLTDVTGPVVIDGARDLLVTVSPVEAALKLISMSDGALIANLAIDLSAVGQVASLALDNSSDAVVVLGAAGVTEVALRKAGAHKVTISGGQDSDPVLFGVALQGDNTAPAYTELPTLETNEDTQLTLAAPGALTESSDAEGDDYVLVQRSQAGNGMARIRIDGSMTYVPNANFNGTDSLDVLLHDGRDASDDVTLEIDVNPVPDPPTDIEVDIDALPEHAVPVHPLGDIEIIDADGVLGGDHDIFVDDDRFEVRDGQLIFVHGEVDYEVESTIFITVTASDPETGETMEQEVAISVLDENDPITGIDPQSATLLENEPGTYVADLVVHDQDGLQTHALTVDDDRFTLIGTELWLKSDVEVDFETEPTVVVNVTATEVPEGGTFTQAIKIEVSDVPEQPTSISLSNETVMELVPGDSVGEVSLDDAAAAASFEFTVDDPRFEIDGNSLKLVDDQFVERASQTEIELTITAEDSQGQFDSISEKFVIEVLENQTPYHNPDNPYDVDRGGDVTALDALVIINYLNTYGPGPVGQGDPGYFYDVNGDGMVTALDALLVLNEMNRIHNGPPDTVRDNKTEGEGEQFASDDPVVPPPQPIVRDDSPAETETDEPMYEQEESSSVQSYAAEYDEHAPADTELDEYAGDSSADEFAERVDETLRLLSDDMV